MRCLSSLGRPPDSVAEVFAHLSDQVSIELSLGGEVPVNDRLGDARRRTDLIHRGGVVAVQGETLQRMAHDDLSALWAW